MQRHMVVPPVAALQDHFFLLDGGCHSVGPCTNLHVCELDVLLQGMEPNRLEWCQQVTNDQWCPLRSNTHLTRSGVPLRIRYSC